MKQLARAVPRYSVVGSNTNQQSHLCEKTVSWAETNHGWADSAGIITSVRNDNLFVAKKSMVSKCSRQLLKKIIDCYCNPSQEDEAALAIPSTATLEPGAEARNSFAPRLEGYVYVWCGFGGVERKGENVRCQRP